MIFVKHLPAPQEKGWRSSGKVLWVGHLPSKRVSLLLALQGSGSVLAVGAKGLQGEEKGQKRVIPMGNEKHTSLALGARSAGTCCP